jgi:hypothetical protein
VSPEVKKELDAINDAYKDLKSLRLAGTIAARLDVGEKLEPQGSFESTFEAPNKFRNAVREGDKNARDDSYVGSSGEKLYFLLPRRKTYITGDAPRTGRRSTSWASRSPRSSSSRTPVCCWPCAVTRWPSWPRGQVRSRRPTTRKSATRRIPP